MPGRLQNTSSQYGGRREFLARCTPALLLKAMLILVTGGSRSGKSGFALRRPAVPRAPVFLATARPG
jgi:hypothetical protein